MTLRFPPGARIGLMGGGQLGRMFALAARPLGYHVSVFTPEPNSPTAQVADAEVVAAYANEVAVTDFARTLDLLTFEFENIPATTIAWCAPHCEVRPAGAILHTAQHRAREKEFLSRGGFPIAKYIRVNAAAELTAAVEELGGNGILKTASFGYDGKGQEVVTSATEHERIWSARGGEESVLEQAIEFEREISVLVARAIDGAMKTFPISENIHRHHILDVTIAPARVSETVARQAAELARAIAEKLDLIGLLAVEMFLRADGTLLVNELAPRPHNSGHWTIEGCATSQFEQQLRAVTGMSLGGTELLRPSAMVNLLGEVWQKGEPNWPAALEVPGVHLHLYGKTEPRAGRKMGHLTAVGGTVEEAVERATTARTRLNVP